MARWFVPTLKATVMLGVLWVGTAARPAEDATAAQGIQRDDATMQANIRPEVRLRKLHLVRPDLIPYPIAFDVVC